MKGTAWLGLTLCLFFFMLAIVIYPAEQLTDHVWSYLRTQFFLFFICLGISVFCATLWIRKLLSYTLELPLSWKDKRKWQMMGLIIIFCLLIAFLYMRFSMLTFLYILLFGTREVWIWKKKRDQILKG